MGRLEPKYQGLNLNLFPANTIIRASRYHPAVTGDLSVSGLSKSRHPSIVGLYEK